MQHSCVNKIKSVKLILQKPDTIGALASSLCIIHCLATPFIFIAQACCSIDGNNAAPLWWQNIDYIFLVISFFAISQAAKTTSKNFMKSVLWINWSVLLVVILNEKANWIPLPEFTIYIVAISLSVLHIYNLNYCQCSNDKCCNNHE